MVDAEMGACSVCRSERPLSEFLLVTDRQTTDAAFVCRPSTSPSSAAITGGFVPIQTCRQQRRLPVRAIEADACGRLLPGAVGSPSPGRQAAARVVIDQLDRAVTPQVRQDALDRRIADPRERRADIAEAEHGRGVVEDVASDLVLPGPGREVPSRDDARLEIPVCADEDVDEVANSRPDVVLAMVPVTL